MKKIELSRGKFALVDDEDYEWLSRWKWHASCGGLYAAHRDGKRGPTIYMHRLIVKAPRGLVVDHADHDTLNNQKSNLRICSQRENILNQKELRGDNTTGVVGVYWDKTRSLFQAKAFLNGKSILIGRFSHLEDAAMAVINYQPKK